MSLSQRILERWKSSQYINNVPQVPLIYEDGEYMIIVDDSQTFIRFMSLDGQVFLALRQNCQYARPDPIYGDFVYMCTKVDPILCSPTGGPDGVRDMFVLNNIVPLFA